MFYESVESRGLEHTLQIQVIQEMEAENIRELLLSFPEVTEETPFDANTVVYKTAGKMFALTNWSNHPLHFNLKCDPQKAELLRDQYSCVVPGYHMNKKHWNTVTVDGSVEDSILQSWIIDSFLCVVRGMPEKHQTRLLQQWEVQQNSKVSFVDQVSEKDDTLRNTLKSQI